MHPHQYSPQQIHNLCFTALHRFMDGVHFKILHFVAQILRVAIQTKALYFQEFTKNLGQGKDIGALRPAPGTEFWGGACCDSHFAWRHRIYDFLPGVETISKTLIREIHGQGSSGYCLTTKDLEIIPCNTLSWSWGPWNHTKQYIL